MSWVSTSNPLRSVMSAMAIPERFLWTLWLHNRAENIQTHTHTAWTPWQRSHQLTWHRFCRWLFHPRPRCCQCPSCFGSPRSSLCSRCPCTHRNSYSRQWFDLWRNIPIISCSWSVGVCRKPTCVLDLPLHRDADGHQVTLTLRLHHMVRF